MIRAIVHFSLKFRGVVLMLAGIVLGYGLYVAQNAKLDVFPNFVQPQVEIQTECPGLAPDQVELLVTLPLEQMINGLGEMESLRSDSIEGLSVITAVFKEGTDVFRARQMLAEKLAETSGTLPTTVKAPRMTPLTSATMDLLKIGLVSDSLTPMQLRSFADWTLKPRLLSVPGVAKCSSYGGDVRQLQIQVIPGRLVAYGLSLADILTTSRLASGVLGAGFIENQNQRITLQTDGQTLTAAALAETAVAHTNGQTVRLKDVARVIEGAEPKYGSSLIQGREGVLLTMSSQYGANTLDVTHRLEAALKEMQPMIERQGIKLYPRLHRPATFIEVALGNMKHSLLLGGILVAVVLFLLLGSVRTAVISLVAIPLSLLAAVLVLDYFGISINTITLGGLAIALGEVVDDSIIDVENIYRRLREYQARLAGASMLSRPGELFDVVLKASIEVRSAVVYATFIVALIFVPVLTLTGLQGSFFAPLAISYILAIMASLLVALTVTPAMSLVLFRGHIGNKAEPWIQRSLKRLYVGLLGLIARWPLATGLAVLVIVVISLTRLPGGQGSLLPEFREGHFVLQVFATPGTGLEEMLRLGKRISQEVLSNEAVATVEQQIGRAELGEDPWEPHRCEFHVELKSVSAEGQETVARQLEASLKKFPGVQYEVLTFLGDRIGETIAGETAPVVVSIFGDDLDVLSDKAREVAKVMSAISTNANVTVKSPPGSPRQVIRLRLDKLSQLGFRPVEVLETLQAACQGAVVGQIYDQNRVASVAVLLDPAERREPEALASMLVTSSQGLRIPLREIADVYPLSGRASISHEGARRRQTLTCTIRGLDPTRFVEEARREVAAKVSFPAGTYAVFSGVAEARGKAQRELLVHSAIAAIGIFLLLWVVFGNWRNLLLVLVNLPFALVGGVLAIWVSNLIAPGESAITIGSLVGFVTLFGITTRNSIMMISHFEHLVTQEGAVWGPETALRGAAERLMPILMTATVTALGLLPLALGSGEAGREIEGPMAIVILGGLVTSTVLNLLVMPTLALRFGKFEVVPDR